MVPKKATKKNEEVAEVSSPNRDVVSDTILACHRFHKILEADF
jgi:hypothetical protein